jgi:hypothetical protein
MFRWMIVVGGGSSLKRWDGVVWIGFVWLRITSGGLL